MASKFQVIDCPHLPKVAAPLNWAVMANGVLYTSQVPIYQDGAFETGDIEKQTRLTFDNLKNTVLAAGGAMHDVCQVQVFLTRSEDFAAVNAIYAEYFSEPFPNRATVLAAGLLAPDIAIEIVAQAYISD